MLIAPLIFGVVVVGIAKVETLKQLGVSAEKPFFTSEIITTFALLIGLLVAKRN